MQAHAAWTTTPPPTIAVLAALVDIPALPGARCRGREELFDATLPPDDDGDGLDEFARNYARRAAQRVCAACPALARCRAWADQLPKSRRPGGVVGGLVTDHAGRRWDGRGNI